MGDVENVNLVSIKPMGFDDPLGRDGKRVEFEGWGEVQGSGRTRDPYEEIRLRMGFGGFSPIGTDEEDNNEK